MKLEYSFWRNQKIFLPLAARSVLNLYECTVSASGANSTLWIFKEQPIDQEILINNKVALLKATLVLNTFCCRKKLVEVTGLEPATYCLQSNRSTRWATPPKYSYWRMVGLVGLEPTTPALSRQCSNQLSYRPKIFTPELSLRKFAPMGWYLKISSEL